MFEATPAQSEYVTRKKLIDRKLKDAGWGIVGFDPSKSLQALIGAQLKNFQPRADQQTTLYVSAEEFSV
jgi:hypothetical protein